MVPLPEKALCTELLSARYDLARFDSGNEELNDYLKNDALKEQRQLLSKTQLCFHRDRLAGFITLTTDSIRIDKDKLDPSQIIDGCDYPAYPCILIARLAVDKKLHGYGVGSYLLSLAIGFVLEAPLGCRYLAVDPKEEAAKFYEKFGFKYWTKSRRRMFLNMRDVAQQLEPEESLDLWSVAE
ncbi:MAG: GNAT family N-acetyltransferase [Methanotrichaceae archaeon]|nr:GNAT family N-acetyltransferase [Methanotrichaceae archaeon]